MRLNAVGHFGFGGARQKIEALIRPGEDRGSQDAARVADADDQTRVADSDLLIRLRFQQAAFAGEAALDGDASAEHHGMV